MSEIVTLELSEEVAERAREAARRTGRPLEEVLKEWLTRAAQSEDSGELPPNIEYPVFTPYGNEAAAQVLFDVLKAAESQDKKANPNS